MDPDLIVDHKVASSHVYVGKVHVSGNRKTTSAFIANEFNFDNVDTIADVVDSCQYAYQDLTSMDIFDRVDITLDKGAIPGSCDINVDVIEKQPMKVSAGTEFDSREAALKVEILYRNTFGQAEQLRLSGNLGMSKSGGFDISLFKPRFYESRSSLYGNIFMSEVNRSKYSSYVLDTQGISVSFASPLKFFSLGYSCAKRDVILLGNSSRSISRAARTSVKSAVNATIRSDSRDCAVVPTQGSLWSLSGELGLPVAGDATFVKCTSDVQLYFPMGKSVSLGFSGRSGLLLPYSYGKTIQKGSSATHLPDRFTFGGPLLLRGYGYDSIGPHDGKDMLGGDGLLAGATSLTFAIPHALFQRIGIRGHVFANAGNIISLSDGSPVSYQYMKLRRDFRTSVGAGIIIPTALGRIEINFCRPLNARPSDRTASFQLGISSSFL